jgi:type IV pilus assembly protein PilB
VTTETPRKRLGEILVDENIILPEQIDEALIRQRQTGRRLGQVLIDMGLITHDELAMVLSDQMGVPHVWLRDGLVDPRIVKILPRDVCEMHTVMPMFKVRNILTIALVDSSDIFAIDDIERVSGCTLQPVQCRQSDIEEAIAEYYTDASIGVDTMVEDLSESDVQVVKSEYEDLSMVEEMAEGAQVINLVNYIILNAIKDGVSDIHIEPDARIGRVRCRLDGVLQEVMTPRLDMHPAIVSRVKVMGRMDIAERRVPQDGRMQVVADGREVDIRVSSMPTVLGEKVVLRLLDKAKVKLDLNRLGIYEQTLTSLKRELSRPHGMLLVTGPTGSGKTTTLYSALSHISTVRKNVVTIENPVEYQLELVNQVNVHEEQGLTFANTLRSVLRQDPDVVMVGEIRDKETAEVAVQASLTGHLVLSTLHTNESAGAIVRLVEMGIESYLLTSAIVGVVAQRLIRTVCSDCATNYFPPRELLDRVGWHGNTGSFVVGSGCKSCFDTGLRGRTGIHEILVMDDGLRECILQNPTIQSIQNYATLSGMRTLRDDAFRMIETGRTTFEEAMSVVFLDDAEEPALAAVHE